MSYVRPFIVASGVALLAVPPVRGLLETAMWSHMLVQMPLLFSLGALAGKRAVRTGTHSIDIELCGWIFVTTTLTVWMIPAAMDAAVASASIDAAKFIAILATGACSRQLIQAGSTPLTVFFGTNIVGMMAIAGLLYQDAERRLCNAYLLDDQLYAGRGLVTLAVGVSAAVLIMIGRRALEPVADNAGAHAPAVNQRASIPAGRRPRDG
ncbi:hypothetical protein [Burkholderia ambifaria]|uniref:hypothetical protein n=1 Tax=Burkholderia ambifaria TaxID=152480 RepID=UPI00159201EF|nr:hypothetical protein [Burkholderia ambifaria]